MASIFGVGGVPSYINPQPGFLTPQPQMPIPALSPFAGMSFGSAQPAPGLLGLGGQAAPPGGALRRPGGSGVTLGLPNTVASSLFLGSQPLAYPAPIMV